MRRKAVVLSMGLALAALGASAGCSTRDEFRAVATPAIQSGVSQILNGLLDGFFAAIAVEPGGTSN